MNSLSKKTLRQTLLVASVLMLASFQSLAALVPVKLQCENRVDPLGVDVAQPRFIWQVQSDERDQKQTAYQILAASSKKLLENNRGDLWDSGRVSSDNSINVEYAGSPLISRQQCFWKVKVWDKNGHASNWSASARWSMGLLEQSDWQGKWIGRDDDEKVNPFSGAKWIWFPEGNPAKSAPPGTIYFRRTLTLPPGRKPVAATCILTADNAFELAINGKKAGLGSDWKQPVTVDVTTLLQAGANLFAIAATNAAGDSSPAGLILTLHIKFAEGDPVDIVTDDQWESSTDQNQWTKAMALGSYGMGPWGNFFDDEAHRLAARYLRQEFSVEKKVTRATAYVCGLGFFDLFLNGKKVSDDMMNPALSDYHKTAYYVTFDVTDQLSLGTNTIGVILGNGRFYAPRLTQPAAYTTYGYPKLLLQLEVEYADGTKATVVSDEHWRLTTDGPIRANNEYDGEEYDARMEMPGWDQAGFDAAKWKPAQVVSTPGGKLRAQMIEPMRVTEVLKPVGITNPKPGVFEVDFGQNFYGAIRLKASGSNGATVRMVCAYSLLPDGTLKTADNRAAKATDIYTFNGNGVETWSPRFKGQGFRHVEVTGFPGTPTADDFEGLFIHTDVASVGEFQCSNDLINRIHSAMRRGMRMYLRSAPLDPDRDERQAWMGDPAKDAESEAYNFNVAPFYMKWMDDVGQSQRADSSIPDVAMYWSWGDGVEWASVFTIIPDWFINFYSDDRVAEMHYAAMKAWVLAMRKHEQPDGTLKSTSYGDWCDTYTMDGKMSENGATPGELVSTAYQYNNYRIMERLAKSMGHAEDERDFAALAEKLKTAFNRTFLDPQTHTYRGKTQCGYVLALKFGLVPDDQRDAVIANLVDDIMIKNHGHLSVGLIGMQWLMQTLTDIGRPDVAWTIATQTTRPSWGYMLSKGATTIWERWDCDTRDPGMNSEALLMQAGNMDAWLYQTLAGIRPDPEAQGFKKIIIKPEVVGDLTWVKASYDSVHGRISSEWHQSVGQFDLRVTIPANTTATVYLPTKDIKYVTESGQPAVQSTGVKFLRMENGAAVFEVAGGKYEFKSDK
jgi:alpha-L-rhamnosidase